MKSAKVWKWIYKNGKNTFPSILLLTVLSVIISLISLSFAVVSKDVFDIATGQASGDIFKTCIWLIALLLLQLVIQVLISFINVHANTKMEIDMRRNIFKNLITRDYLSISKYHSGELLNRLTSDVSVIVSGIITIVPSVALLLTTLIGSFWYLYILDPMFALIIVCVGPFILISSRLYSAKYKSLHKDCQQADGKVRSFMQEALQNLIVIKSFNNQDDILDQNEDLQKKSYKLRIKRIKISLLAHICMFIGFNAGYYFAVAYCAVRLSQSLMTFGTVSAILQLVNRIQTPFKDISSLIPKFLSVIASTERILELYDLKSDMTAGEEIDLKLYNEIESIEFHNVTFAYDETPVLNNASFSVKKGEFCVIGGESGAGKSTAIKLILGIILPQSGEIYVKTKNGDKIPLNILTRGLFAYVPQGNLILSGTIRENLMFGKKDATDEEIIKAAKTAQIWDFIDSLDDGLETELGEKGLGLSEGQIQRIAIARALLYGAPILLLDECTSALDSKTELAFLEDLKRMENKTCIIVSHKRAAFDICDHVIDYTKLKENKNK